MRYELLLIACACDTSYGTTGATRETPLSTPQKPTVRVHVLCCIVSTDKSLLPARLRPCRALGPGSLERQDCSSEQATRHGTAIINGSISHGALAVLPVLGAVLCGGVGRSTSAPTRSGSQALTIFTLFYE